MITYNNLNALYYMLSIHTLQVEIFPTPVRAAVSGGAYSISRLMSGLMPFILLPVLQDSGASMMFTVIAAAILVVILDVALIAPSTTGKPLNILGNSDQVTMPRERSRKIIWN